MRIWLLAFAGCWNAAPIEPVAPRPRVAHARPRVTPSGYFVPDLVTRRLETNAFDDGFEVFAGQPAALIDNNGLFQPQTMIRAKANRYGVAPMTLSRPTSGIEATDPRLIVQYCIDISGRVTSAHVEIRDDDQAPRRLGITPSDRETLEKLRGWRFAPYFVAGKPVTACSFIDYSSISS